MSDDGFRITPDNSDVLNEILDLLGGDQPRISDRFSEISTIASADDLLAVVQYCMEDLDRLALKGLTEDERDRFDLAITRIRREWMEARKIIHGYALRLDRETFGGEDE